MRKLSLYLFLFLSLFQPLHSLANNMGLEYKLEKHKKYFPKGNLKKNSYVKQLIEYMYEFDQNIRKEFLQDRDNHDLQLLLKTMDAFHISKMKEILKEYGWIIISRFGQEYEKKAWLLGQHADDDPFFQAGVLFILSKLVDKGETDKKNYAYLYDRVAAKFHQIGMLQKYGTQVNIKNTEIELQPYEGSLEDVDKRRGEIGLEPLNDYLKRIQLITLRD